MVPLPTAQIEEVLEYNSNVVVLLMDLHDQAKAEVVLLSKLVWMEKIVTTSR